MVAAVQSVAERRFPSAMTVADIDRRLASGARHALEIGDDTSGQIDQFAFIDIGSRPVHGLQNPVRHDRRAGDRKGLAALIEAHIGGLRKRGLRAAYRGFWRMGRGEAAGHRFGCFSREVTEARRWKCVLDHRVVSGC